MSERTIVDLRNKLFDVIDGLSSQKMDIETANAICEAAQVIINSAKAESQYIQVAGGRSSGFIGQQGNVPQKLIG
jgi:hypothetical protein